MSSFMANTSRTDSLGTLQTETCKLPDGKSHWGRMRVRITSDRWRRCSRNRCRMCMQRQRLGAMQWVRQIRWWRLIFSCRLISEWKLTWGVYVFFSWTRTSPLILCHWTPFSTSISHSTSSFHLQFTHLIITSIWDGNVSTFKELFGSHKIFDTGTGKK